MAQVIKAANSPNLAGTQPRVDGTSSTQLYLDQVRAQAATILAQAQNEADAIRQQAQRQGLQAAATQCNEKLSHQLNNLLPALHKAIAELNDVRQAWLAHAEKSNVQLAIAIAECILRHELNQRPEVTMTLVREALEMATGSTELQLRLHPDDHAVLQSQVLNLINELARVGKTTVIADDTISRGGCRIDTRFGSIDQQLEAQLARIEQELI